jgi:Holliday junction DNA helicase RuvB
MLDILELCGISAIMESIKKKIPSTTQPEEKQVYHANEVAPKKYSFRPQTLDQYIGQERAKSLIQMNLEKIRTIKPVHFIISGTKGHGKSTLAYIIAKELDFNIFTYVGGSFTLDNLRLDFLPKCYESEKPSILFIDEIHGLKKETGEYLYPILEDFLLPEGNIKVRPFVFLGATTEKNILLKKFSPMVDRCGAQINLEHYKAEDIKMILKQYNDQIYKANIDENIYDLLSINTRYNPRTSLAMFDDLMVCKDIEKVLNAHRIVKNSLTTDDIIILEHLQEIDKPVGLETLALIIQQTKQDYTSLIEPFILSQGYIGRTSKGRVITAKGKQLLGEINANK